jgi:outer membrane receptor protein involved in Fe transport
MRSTLLLGLLCFLLAAAPLRAEDSLEREIENVVGRTRLTETVITPARRAEPLAEVPFSTAVVREEDLSGTRAPRSLPEALRLVPGVMVQKTAYGQGSPYIRGLTGFRTLMLIDGIRLNNSVFRDGPNQYLATVDNFSISRLELVRGPGSVLYGSDSMGGTLNMFPVTPALGPDGYGFGGRVFTRYATAEHSSVTRVSVQGGVDSELGILIGADRKHFGDLTAGSGRLPDTGYDEWDVDGRLVWAATTALDLTLGYQHVTQDDVPRTHKTIHARSFHGTTIGNERKRDLDQQRNLLYLRGDLGAPFPFADSLSFTLSWHSQDEFRDRVKSNGSGDRTGVEVDTLGLTAQMTSETTVGLLTYGLDAYRDWVDSYSHKYDAEGNLTGKGIQGPVGDDSNYDLIGVFLEDRVDLGSKFVLSAGARFSYARAVAREVADPETGEKISLRDDYSGVVGSARVTWFGIEDVSIYGGVSQGFRAPNLSDLTRLDSARSNEIEVPSPGLDPENTVSFELGARGAAGPVRGAASVYYTILDDLIQRTPTGEVIDGDEVVTKSNIGDGFVQGIELTAEWDFADDFTLFGSGGTITGKADTYPTSEREKEREYLDRLPPLSGLVGVRYANSDGYLVGGRLRMADKADRLSTRDRSDTQRIPPGGTPGYAVVDLFATVPVCESVILGCGLENVFDKDYRVHGSGQNEPGRNFWVSVTFRF